MKKLLFVVLMLICTLGASAQVRIGVQADSVRMAEYRDQIGLDMSVPDFEVKKIDEAKMGVRLANLLRYFEENYHQSAYGRGLSKLIGEQYEELGVYNPEVTKMKLQSVSKSGNAITILYKVWLGENPKQIKQTLITFHFYDGVSESRIVNDMFSYISHYVKAREQLNK